MKADPAVGAAGRATLRRVRILRDQAQVCDEADRILMLGLVTSGYLRRTGPAHSRLTLTQKGERYLDALMRCE